MTLPDFQDAYRMARRVAVGVIGGTVLAVGVALLVLPGPAFVVIPVGLGILSAEFAFARRWLRQIGERTGLGRSVASADSEDSSPEGPRGALTRREEPRDAPGRG